MIKKINARSNSTGKIIEVDAMTSKIETTSLESTVRTFRTVINYVLVDNQRVDLYLDNTFRHPKDSEVYSIDVSLKVW